MVRSNTAAAARMTCIQMGKVTAASETLQQFEMFISSQLISLNFDELNRWVTGKFRFYTNRTGRTWLGLTDVPYGANNNGKIYVFCWMDWLGLNADIRYAITLMYLSVLPLWALLTERARSVCPDASLTLFLSGWLAALAAEVESLMENRLSKPELCDAPELSDNIIQTLSCETTTR